MAKEAFPALRAPQQLQRLVNDFSLRLKPRQLARLAHKLSSITMFVLPILQAYTIS